MKTTVKKITALTLIFVLALSMLTACGSQKIDLSDYMTVTFSGTNKAGRAQVRLSTLDLESAIMSTWKEKDNSWEKLAALTKLEMSLDCSVNKNEKLKNGDKVKVTVTYDKAAAKTLGITLTGLEETVKVKGLSK